MKRLIQVKSTVLQSLKGDLNADQSVRQATMRKFVYVADVLTISKSEVGFTGVLRHGE